ncbi:MAG: hypothetical protein IJE07_14865 [Clostridia bacterium]|nr:hypothetical protein [Clostridia bacterium]
MKRILCILLCLMLAAPAALAEDYSPTRLFRQQFITGGNGLRGTVSVTASGVAEWLDLLLPFTAAKVQVRIIGEQQAGKSDLVPDDDDWQMKLWVKDAQGNQQGLTYVYGTPEGIFLSSELLPGEFLTLPVKNVNLPYQVSDGETLALLNAFNPLQLPDAAQSGNVTAWSALGELFAIDSADWAAEWTPVLTKYETLVDMWLADYATPTVVTGNGGRTTLRASYEIPAEALKAEAKYLLGLMMNDVELLTLAMPYLTDEQCSLYLNPAMLWFYEYCIDVAPLQGSILLERETTMLGETTAMNISLPLLSLPQELTAPLSAMLQQAFTLPYDDALAGVDRISIRQAGEELSISLSSPQYTVTTIVSGAAAEESSAYSGFLRITPAVDSEQPPLSAAFAYSASHTITEDEEYNTLEAFAWSLNVTPDMSLAEPEDAFHSTYIEFAPLSFEAKVTYTKRDKVNSPVQLAIQLAATLPDAELALTASLKVAERWAHEALPTTGGEDISAMSDGRKAELRTIFVQHAMETMMNLNAAPAQ